MAEQATKLARIVLASTPKLAATGTSKAAVAPWLKRSADTQKNATARRAGYCSSKAVACVLISGICAPMIVELIQTIPRTTTKLSMPPPKIGVFLILSSEISQNQYITRPAISMEIMMMSRLPRVWPI